MTDAQRPAEIGGRLLVLRGVHAGAAARIVSRERLAVGADDTCDVVLGDAGLAPRQVEIRAWDGRAGITALAPGVVLDDGRALPPQSRRVVSLPARLRLGEAVELLVDEDEVTRGKDGRR